MSVPASQFDTVILAGGDAVRMGGADKPVLTVGGTAMVVSVARAAAAAGTRRLIVVGPARGGAVGDGLSSAGAVVVSEDRPGGGPVPALRRGLAEVAAPWLLVLAADLPFLDGKQLTRVLAAAQAAGAGGAVLADGSGRLQWLAGGWQADVLRGALAAYRGSSLHGLLAPLRPVPVRLRGTGSGQAPWRDCDTPADLAAARRAWLERSPGGPGGI